MSSSHEAAPVLVGILVILLPAAQGRAEENKPELKGTWRGALSQETFVIPAFVISMEFTQKGEKVTGKLRSAVRGNPAQFAVMSFTGVLKDRVLTFHCQKFLERTALGPGLYWVLPSGKLTLSHDDAALQGPWTGNNGAARGALVVRDATKMALRLEQIERVAKALDCEVASVRAVIDVEAADTGFLPSGLPRIRFEAHEFSRLTGGKYDASYRNVSSKERNPKLYKKGDAEYDRLVVAIKLDTTAALGATSWGRFQVMGFNYRQCGYDKIEDFVASTQESEGKQLDAFVAYLRYQGLDKPLREKRWREFARGYNGSDFASNKYDEKLADAYKHYARETRR
jgi:hypothetical protein